MTLSMDDLTDSISSDRKHLKKGGDIAQRLTMFRRKKLYIFLTYTCNASCRYTLCMSSIFCRSCPCKNSLRTWMCELIELTELRRIYIALYTRDKLSFHITFMNLTALLGGILVSTRLQNELISSFGIYINLHFIFTCHYKLCLYAHRFRV